MAEETPHIVLKLDTKDPIELGDFVTAFTSLSNQYDRFIRQEHPELTPDAQIYIREVRSGCIEADLIPWLTTVGLPGVVHTMDQLLIIEAFVRKYGARLTSYFKIGGREPDITRTELGEMMGQVAAIANDPNGKSAISAVYFEDGKKKIKVAVQFDTSQARIAAAEIEHHRKQIEHKSRVDHPRVLMVFYQSNVKQTQLGKRTGERVVIEALSPRDLAVVYASDMAEERIKYVIRESADNVYKKGFVVDVNVEYRQGKPVAYRVTHVHDVIDID